MLHLRESGHTILRGTSALARGPLKSEGGEKNRFTTTVIQRQQSCCFAMIISVNQLSLYGAVSDWCGELAQQISEHSSSSTGRPVAEMNDESGSRISPSVVSILTNPPSMYVPVHGDFLRRHNKRFENLPEDI